MIKSYERDDMDMERNTWKVCGKQIFFIFFLSNNFIGFEPATVSFLQP